MWKIQSRAHYGTWLGNKKQTSFQEQIRQAIDAVLKEKPKDFEEFLEKMEAAGIEVNRERKNLRFRVQGQENYTRCNTLKGDYTEQAIKERISGVRIVSPQRNSTYRQRAKIGLLLDIEAVRSGKGQGYERWAKVFNLKQLSQAVMYLKEHGDMSYEDLKEKTSAVTTRFNDLSEKIKSLEEQMTANCRNRSLYMQRRERRILSTEKLGTVRGFEQSMKLISFCIRRRRNTLTVWNLRSCLLSKISGKNMSDC